MAATSGATGSSSASASRDGIGRLTFILQSPLTALARSAGIGRYCRGFSARAILAHYSVRNYPRLALLRSVDKPVAGSLEPSFRDDFGRIQAQANEHNIGMGTAAYSADEAGPASLPAPPANVRRSTYRQHLRQSATAMTNSSQLREQHHGSVIYSQNNSTCSPRHATQRPSHRRGCPGHPR